MEAKPSTPKKLTPPNTDHLEALHEKLEDARYAVIDLCESLADHHMLSSWQIAPAMQDWKKAAEAWNEAVDNAAVDVMSFMEEHSERWLESERGQAFEAWNVALANAQIDTEPSDKLRLSLTIDLEDGIIEGEVENADEVLPETPDIPELDL